MSEPTPETVIRGFILSIDSEELATEDIRTFALAALDVLVAEGEDRKRVIVCLDEANATLVADREAVERQYEVTMANAYDIHVRAEKAEARVAELQAALTEARLVLQCVQFNASSWHGQGEEGPRRAHHVIDAWITNYLNFGKLPPIADDVRAGIERTTP